MKVRLREVLASVAVFFSRLGVLPPNFSPVGSFGFHAHNLPLFLLVTLGFDYLYGGFYKSVLFTYAGFIAYYVLGRLAKNNLKRQLALLPLASFLFFLISNFGVFWFWYERSWSGLIQCYLLALPFYRNTFASDLFFGYAVILLRYLWMVRENFGLLSGENHES